MNLLIELIILGISLIVLGKSSHIMIESSVKISKITRLGELAIGFLILSLITTLPELSISLIAITTNNVGISIGNILGSNIANICLILGAIAIIKPLEITENNLRRLLNILPILALIIFMFIMLPYPNKFIGIILLSGFIFFAYYSIKKKMAVSRLREREPEDIIHKIVLPTEFYKNIFIIIIGFLGVLLSAYFVVRSASNIALLLGVAQIIIGSILVAIGTSLPEFAIAWQSVKEGHQNLAIGNIVGSCMINSTLILGLVILLSKFSINMIIFSKILFFVLLSTILFWTFLGSWGRRRLERFEGMMLLGVYALFVIMTIVIGY